MLFWEVRFPNVVLVLCQLSGFEDEGRAQLSAQTFSSFCEPFLMASVPLETGPLAFVVVEFDDLCIFPSLILRRRQGSQTLIGLHKAWSLFLRAVHLKASSLWKEQTART